MALNEKISVSACAGKAMNCSGIRNAASSLVAASRPSLINYSLPPRSFSRLTHRLRGEGVRFGKGISTSQARAKANSVTVMKPFFDSLSSVFKKFPILLAEPGRIVALNESPLHQQAEKLKPHSDVAFVPTIKRWAARLSLFPKAMKITWSPRIQTIVLQGPSCHVDSC